MDPQEMRLRYYPDPVLTRRGDAVTEFGEPLVRRARRMFEIMYENKGIGLAAPQVGWSAQLFVANLSGDPENRDEELVFANPKVSEPAGEASFEEGCLSFPGIHLDVVRPDTVKVTAQDVAGEWFEMDTDDLLSRCVQHEFDHLDGILFTSRVSTVAKMMVRKDLKELERKYKDEKRAG